MTDRDLLTAYLDGVSELTADERKRVEALLAVEPALADEAASTRELLGQLRELPPEGDEPDWTLLERSIRGAVGPTVPLSWWARLRWLVPVSALAVAAVVVVVIVHGGKPPLAVTTTAQTGAPLVAPAPEADPTALWLDGQAVELGDIDPSVLLDDDGTDDVAVDGSGLLPASDLNWIDGLDDHALDRAEQWLDDKGHKKGHKKG